MSIVSAHVRLNNFTPIYRSGLLGHRYKFIDDVPQNLSMQFICNVRKIINSGSTDDIIIHFVIKDDRTPYLIMQRKPFRVYENLMIDELLTMDSFFESMEIDNDISSGIYLDILYNNLTADIYIENMQIVLSNQLYNISPNYGNDVESPVISHIRKTILSSQISQEIDVDLNDKIDVRDCILYTFQQNNLSLHDPTS